MNGLLKRTCPNCKSQDIIRSHRRGFIEEYLLPSFRVRAYRCIECDTRFYALASLQEATSSTDKAA
jgi:hypothetical protein